MRSAIRAQEAVDGIAGGEEKCEALVGPSTSTGDIGEDKGCRCMVMSSNNKKGEHGRPQSDHGQDRDQLVEDGHESGGEDIEDGGQPDQSGIGQVLLPGFGRVGGMPDGGDGQNQGGDKVGNRPRRQPPSKDAEPPVATLHGPKHQPGRRSVISMAQRERERRRGSLHV